MFIEFYKYQGAGNDFILIDNRSNLILPDEFSLFKLLCDRRFGIGSDGIMLLTEHPEVDFEMKYYNSDGYEGSMCGNGGRCMVSFARKLGLFGNDKTRFLAMDGIHEAICLVDNRIRLKMSDVNSIEEGTDYFYMNTGSPHYVVFVSDTKSVAVEEEGRIIRYNKRFMKVGTNVNFVHAESEYISVRTYERGVEAETLSCGTGAVASAIAFALKKGNTIKEVEVQAPGGKLKVYFDKKDNNFINIWLEGPAEFVYEGKIWID